MWIFQSLHMLSGGLSLYKFYQLYKSCFSNDVIKELFLKTSKYFSLHHTRVTWYKLTNKSGLLCKWISVGAKPWSGKSIFPNLDTLFERSSTALPFMLSLDLKDYMVNSGSTGIQTKGPTAWFKSLTQHLVNVWPWETYLISLCISFYKIGTAPTSRSCCVNKLYTQNT